MIEKWCCIYKLKTGCVEHWTLFLYIVTVCTSFWLKLWQKLLLYLVSCMIMWV